MPVDRSEQCAKCVAADGVKVRLQTQPHDGSRKNMMQMVNHVVRSDGFTGLYRGVREDSQKNTKRNTATDCVA